MPITKTSQKNKGERAGTPRRYILMTILCGLFLVVGFFFAASQHFSAMKYGMKNSALRKQIDELETEKRQLMLAKEIALSPAEIKKAAKKMGLTAMTASNIEVFRGAGNPAPEQQPKTEKIAAKIEIKPSEKIVAAQIATKKSPEKELKAEKAPKAEKKPEKKSIETKEKTPSAAR